MKIWGSLLFALMLHQIGVAQFAISGKIIDDENTPIPYATIYVKNQSDQRTVSDATGAYEIRLFEGEYYLVVEAPGYEQRTFYMAVTNKDQIREFQLFLSAGNELDEYVVSSKKVNHGRRILLEVLKRRDTINPWNHPHTVDVYTKAREDILSTNKSADEELIKDELEEKSNSKINLLETKIKRSYNPPNQVKEIREAYTLHGNERNLYYTSTVKANFNFFQNLLQLEDLHQSPIISPISNPGILAYKYKLVDQYMENGQLIDKIKITSRSTSTSTLSGYIYVIDSIWMLQKLELSLYKGNLFIYDYFTINQDYENRGDTLNVLTEQKLSYGIKYKNDKTEAYTHSSFYNYDFKPQFSKKYFGNELSSIELEAYKRDSTFWTSQRKVSLTYDEKRMIIVEDSLRDLYSRKEYTDSIDSVYNKVTFLKVVWFGIEHRNRELKTQWTLSSLAEFLRPIYIAGPRLAPNIYYFKKWENQKYFDAYSEVSYGFLNKDVKGRLNGRYLYDPFKLASFRVGFSHEFDVIRSYDAISQIYKRDNFIEATELSVGHNIELLNGLYLSTDLTFMERRSVSSYKFFSWLDGVLPNNEPNYFDTYQALLFDATLSYTPKQKYMREPYRKVVLGSKYPTFYASLQQGINGLFGSDVKHTYGLLGMQQTFKIATLGTSSYHVKSGKFLNADKLQEPDFKFQRRSDPLWFSNPLHSFQDQDSSLRSKDYYIEAHFVHHDNGAIINKIPFMKKTRIGLVAGAGALYVHEFSWRHYEVLGGLERTFKVGKTRLRLGVYGVLSDGNNITPRSTFKFSFSVLNERSMKFDF